RRPRARRSEKKRQPSAGASVPPSGGGGAASGFGGGPLSPPVQHVRKHWPDPCGPCLHVSAGSRVPPVGHGVVRPPHTQAPPPLTHVSSLLPLELDVSPELLVDDVLPDDVDVEDAPPSSSVVPVFSSELHACVERSAAVERKV